MVDFRKLYGIFVDEANERLEELEKGLLQLERSPGERELLNTVFRAAHTIKGSSGSIGLHDISHFTHSMEEILDLVRQDRLPSGKELINVLLEATDLIREMVGAVASGNPFSFSSCTAVLERMESLKAGGGAPGRGSLFRILFTPAPDLFRRGIDPSLLIDDLRGSGEIIRIRANSDSVPPLSALDPETVYLHWEILMRTDRKEEEIRKVFEFVEDGSRVEIVPAAPGSDIPLIGRILVEEGKVREEDVEDALKSQRRLGEILVEQGKVTPEDVEKAVERQNSRKSEAFRNSVASTIRVDLRKLDHLINTVGEMVIIHSMFQQAHQSGGNGKSDSMDIILSQLQRIGKDIQESALSLRMLPVGEVFQRFTRLVRELSLSRGKKVELVITGEETELDKGVLEKIADPLVHLIRNSLDHGIEMPEERTAKGKAEKGTIHLSAYQMGDSVFIEVEDDGRGLDREKILKKALLSGVVKSAEGLSDEQVYNLVFLPGFSTADAVTDISGRGVGMDVVKRNIESLSGRISLRSAPGRGMCLSIKLPLTLAIIDGLVVVVGGEIFIVPLTSVVESLRPLRKEVKTLGERGEVVDVRGEYIPLVRLHEVLGVPPEKRDPWEAIVVVTVCDGRKHCLLVDDLLGQQQVVIKHLGTAVPKVDDIAGGTILGDGRVALVLDVPGIAERAAKIVMA